ELSESAELVDDFVVGPARPDGADLSIEEFTGDSTSAHHALTHEPKARDCPVCLRSRLRRTPARRRVNPVRATEFGGRWSIDHIGLGPQHPKGVGGAHAVLTVYDEATGFALAYPCKDKTTASVVEALRAFAGTAGLCKRIRSDGAPELSAAVALLPGVVHEVSIPYRPQSNSLAERYNQRVLSGTRALLCQSGIPYAYWPTAVWSWSCLSNLTRIHIDGKTPYELRFARPPPLSKQVPYGIECAYLSHRTGGLKFDPVGVRGIVLSRHFAVDGQALRDYQVLPLLAVMRGERPTPLRTLDVEVMQGFPLTRPRDEVLREVVSPAPPRIPHPPGLESPTDTSVRPS
ncbi:MAG: transposase, partial [Rickettsiales bacterium]